MTQQFLLQYHDRLMVRATELDTAFIPWVGTNLSDILCVQEERAVTNDNTVRYQSLRLQIPQDPPRSHDVKVTVRVHAYPDGTLAVFHGLRCLARYNTDGQLIETGRAHLPRKGPAHASNDLPIVDTRPMVRTKFRTWLKDSKGRTGQIRCYTPDKFTCVL